MDRDQLRVPVWLRLAEVDLEPGLCAEVAQVREGARERMVLAPEERIFAVGGDDRAFLDDNDSVRIQMGPAPPQQREAVAIGQKHEHPLQPKAVEVLVELPVLRTARVIARVDPEGSGNGGDA